MTSSLLEIPAEAAAVADKMGIINPYSPDNSPICGAAGAIQLR
jgi:hypothetical protein